MPLKSTGNAITKIKQLKNDVIIYFGEDFIKISKDSFGNFRIYEGLELSKDSIKELLSFSRLNDLMNYALSLLSKSHYSCNKMKEKLSKKGATEKEIKKIITSLKRNDLIDDRALIEDHICWAIERCVGKKKIIKELMNLGIEEKDVEKINFPVTGEKQKALAILPKLNNKYDSLSYENKKKHIYNSLKSLGFEDSVVEYAIKKIPSINQEDESDKIIKDHDKAVIRLSKKYSGNELDKRVYTYLKNKGYSHYDIQDVMEVKEYDD